MKLNGLEKYFKTMNGEIVDFKQIEKNSFTPLMYAFRFNEELEFNLNKEQWDYLIKHSDLKQTDNIMRSPGMIASQNNKEEKLNLTKEQFDYLIKNSDLQKVDNYDRTILMVVLEYNKYQNLSNEHLKYLINNSDLSLIKDESSLIKLKQIQSALINDEILSKIEIKEENNKKNKI